MSYRIKTQETIPVAIKRIAEEQIERAIYRLTHTIKAGLFHSKNALERV